MEFHHFLIHLLPRLHICFLLTATATPLSFDFSTFQQSDTNLNNEGDAAIGNDQFIHLTKAGPDQLLTESVGRVTYREPFLLRQNTTGELADFTTHFTSVIDPPDNSRYGLVFFLAPNGSLLNRELGKGGSMGLPVNSILENPIWSTNEYAFVAVEFDTYRNREQSVQDPPGDHVEVPLSPNKAPDSLTTRQSSQNQSQIPSPGPSSIAKSRKQNIPVLIVVVIICSTVGVVFLLGGFIWFILWIKNRSPATGESNTDEHPMIHDSADLQFEMETGPRQFSYRELELATSNFSDGNKLGHGGFGDVYKGFLNSSNCEVAVKKILKDSDQGPKEYGAEIRILSSLRHRNLVQLLGWCHEVEVLLVYEFMPNGSLDSHLFRGRSSLSWENRYRIAQGLASVLMYIQHLCNQYVVHRDIKSSNIMLDSKFNPKLGDFGLARFVDHDKSSKTTIVAGTVGYIAPEYVTEKKASKDTDIFSFGVVALEIACGRKPFDHRLGSDKFDMLKWVWELYKGGKIIEAADPKLGATFNQRQMECLLIVGLWCSHQDKIMRPGIEKVIDVLNFKDPFPDIPAPAERSIYLTSSDEHQIEY